MGANDTGRGLTLSTKSRRIDSGVAYAYSKLLQCTHKVNTMNTQTGLDLSADIIDVRDIIARVEELENERDAIGEDDPKDADLACEHCELAHILDTLKGNGGDEQWRGDWYPVTLIRDSYFTDYAREMLEDCGTIPRDLPSWVEIDWDATARNVRTDYTCTDIAGVTYWYR